MNEPRRTAMTNRGLMVDDASPDLLRALLDMFDWLLRDTGLDLDQVLAPGLDRSDVVSRMAAEGLSAPAELIVWYGWHNGLRRDEAGLPFGELPFMFPASLDSCAESHAYAVTNTVPLGLWAPQWWPLESDRGLAAYCWADRDLPPVMRFDDSEFFDFLEPSIEHQVASFCTVVSWWIECLETGIVKYDTARSVWDRDMRAIQRLDQGTFVLM